MQHKWRVGVVSYLNAKPLVEGLEAEEDFELIYEVPARLPGLLDRRAIDAALVPVVDLACRNGAWRIVSDACIGCDGETLTVRVFSRIRPEAVHTLHVDVESHTSVVLAQIIWQEHYGHRLEVIPFQGMETVTSLSQKVNEPRASARAALRKPAIGIGSKECEAILLIGDKVVHDLLADYRIQTDLGSVWKSLTSLPFVFAVWAAPRDVEGDVTVLARGLSRARDRGLASAKLIAARFGPSLGWPVTLAEKYLTDRMKFTLGPRQRLGMARFLELAKRYELLPARGELTFA